MKQIGALQFGSGSGSGSGDGGGDGGGYADGTGDGYGYGTAIIFRDVFALVYEGLNVKSI